MFLPAGYQVRLNPAKMLFFGAKSRHPRTGSSPERIDVETNHFVHSAVPHVGIFTAAEKPQC
jgi:hypothetical protein